MPSAVKPRVKHFMALVASVLMLVGLPSMSAHAYPPGSAVLTISDNVVPVGSSFTATVRGCKIGELVTFTITPGQAPGVTVACVDDGTGSGVATASLPVPLVAGSYQVVAVFQTSQVTLTSSLTVTGKAIAKAGTDGVGQMSLTALGLVGLGGCFLLVAGRRRKQAAV